MTSSIKKYHRALAAARPAGSRPTSVAPALLVVSTALLVALVAPAIARAQDNADAAPRVFVEPEEAFAAISNGAIILDAGDLSAVPRQGPAGAVPVDWRDFSDPHQQGRLLEQDVFLAERIGALGVGDDVPVYVIGSWEHGWGEEGRIYWMLVYLGHENTFIVDGGHDAWHAAGLPTGPPVEQPTRATFTVDRQPQFAADLDEVRSGDATLLDVREAEEFFGATPYGSERGGHVPGSVSVPWRAFLEHDGSLRDASELPLQADPGQRVVAYCTGGVRSGLVFAILRAQGWDNVANYPGSWWEYAASDAEVER